VNKPTAQRQAEERPASREASLLDYVERLGRFRQERRAVHIHLSRLQSYNRREHHLRIAVKTVDSMISLFEGQAFLLSNGDIVFICRGATVEALRETVLRVRYLFEDDPLIAGLAEAPEQLATLYDIATNYDLFFGVVQGIHDDALRRYRLATSGAAVSVREPVDAHRVGELVDAIARADLTNVTRRQSVCLILPNTPPQPIFRELFVSIADLRDAVMPAHDIAADRGLFQYLTRTLDQRVLAMLRKNDDSAIRSAFSINLNVASLLSQEFLAFDTELRSTARGTIVIELQYPDIIADLEAYFFARDFAKGRAYRLCLDGVSELMLPFIDRERLGVELVKLVWGPRMQAALQSGRLGDYRSTIERLGRARTILCRCDDDEAIRFGQAVGIPMYQGRGVERLLAAAAPRPAAPAPAAHAAAR
jgi:hypothetical protein